MKRGDQRALPVMLGQLLEASPRLSPRGVSWQVWREIVGSQVARRSRPSFVSGSTLFVTVTSSAWAQELSFLSRSILGRLGAAGHALTALRFQVGPVELPARAPEPRRVSKQALPSELAERLSRLEDARLRDLISEAAAYRTE